MKRPLFLIVALLSGALPLGAQAADIDYDPTRPQALRPCDDARQRGRDADALRCYERLAQNADPLVRAEALWGRGDLSGANTAFREANSGSRASVRGLVRWGRLFLEAHQYSEAQSTLEDALEQSAEDPQAQIATARLLAERFNPGAKDLLDAVLKKDDTLIEAHLLRGRLALESGKREEAVSDAERALALSQQQKVAPLEAQTLLGAIEVFGGRDPKRWLDEAQRYNPRYGRIHAELAHFELMRRKYREANVWLLRAVELQPTLWSAHEELGVNFLRLGDRAKAREHLVKAYEGDPFSATTVNTLRLLDSLEQYDVRRVGTPALVMQLHRSETAALAPYVEDIGKRSIALFSERYGWRPSDDIFVELYPDHDDFAVRTAGLPGIGLLGVTFGHVVAMDSPSARSGGDFHWGSTLWHEMAHVFTLSATGHRVPRWLSEGISVFEEWRTGPTPGVSLSPEPLQKFAEGKFLPVADLDEGFIRPDYPNQVQVSYVQAGLTCLFIETRWGFPTLAKLLKQFERDTTTAAAVQAATGLAPAAFDTEFQAFLKQRFAAFLAAPDKYVQLMREAGRAYEAKDFAKAAEASGEAVKLLPEFTEGASGWLLQARAQLDAKDDAGALTTLTGWRTAGGWQPDATRKLATLLDDAKRGPEALVVLESLNYSDPLRAAGHRELGERLLTAGRGAEAEREFRVLLAVDPADTATAQFGLARTSRQGGRDAEARRHVLQALEVAPSFRPAQKLLLELTKDSAP
ncbi:MAG: tetratricopeptide repeat protein [Steroidobacteraceae bacterium]